MEMPPTFRKCFYNFVFYGEPGSQSSKVQWSKEANSCINSRVLFLCGNVDFNRLRVSVVSGDILIQLLPISTYPTTSLLCQLLLLKPVVIGLTYQRVGRLSM